ncbi:hypothetical protein BC939DRAFT_203887 [Gamsiella multidivaricata]|uniref:uncharacterized protein n=1 Tax=Gamsiella multidivaricata TaxID=101098 RepID=UPI0022204227|nr:uncharacterized protein BC939DRAFT_203887 [Gamsiella multidivaricata]KAG0354807.1 hypothetical protein BGZ54_001460 [Gamsiella multidivaricata]KAI7821498.1 hypothetical protein BC939DRAFT_203887 [Gamsiella multidivaricata]
MDPKQPNQAHNSHGQQHASPSSGKGKEPSIHGSSSSGSQPQPSGPSTGLMESIVTSARNMASAFDPRQADLLRQHHSLGPSSGSPNNPLMGSSSKASTSSASRTFQHATSAMETLGSTSGGTTVESTQPTGFRGPSSSQQTGPSAATGEMNWDNFLASSESTLQEDQPYKPPSMSSFGFSIPSVPEAPSALSQQHQHLQHLQHLQHEQQQQGYQGWQQEERTLSESTFQAHSLQPMNLTPANHAAFLEYLKSTADTASFPSASQLPVPGHRQQAQHPQQQWNTLSSTERGPLSNDIYRQQHMDGGEVLAFLESTSYSDYVDQIETEGIEKHQQERREFVYSEATLGPRTQSLFSTLQLIQHLPSERQDIVQYLLQQGTYVEDVWSRPFGHDTAREEGASLAATRAEQDRFLAQAQQQQQSGSDGGSGEGATTEEMERILKQIVDDAKTEVKTGETDGKALNRLMAVRSHIIMGTKL